ncbi:MAG: VOC family protein [Rhizobiaceae bacterium]
MTRVSTHLMFQGSASEALNAYSNVFSDFNVEKVEKYGEGEQGNPGTIKQALVSFGGHRLIVFDSPPVHDFDFTPSMSLFVDFESEDALETAFARLSENGKILMPLNDYGFSKRFGWLSDRFGVSWQLNLAVD